MEELKCDVLVVGAGPSGVPAAVAAARGGASVIVLEEDSLPGGAPVDMYVCMTCGDPRTGIYREMIEYLNEHHDLERQPMRPFHAGLDGCNHWWMPYSYVQTTMHFLSQEKNITLITGARAEKVLTRRIRNGKTRIFGVQASRGVNLPRLTVRAKVTIDATGTGILGELAGCDVRYGADTRADFGEEFAPTERTPEIMPCTLQYITQRHTGNSMPAWDEFDPGKLGVSKRGFVEDRLPDWASSIYVTALQTNRGIYLHWGASVYCEDTRDAVLLGKAHMQALSLIEKDTEIWYRHGFTVQIAPKLGVRECRRVMGDYVLTIYDMLNGNFEYDTVAVSSYGVDLWGSTRADEKGLNKCCKTYGIPYRSLLPRGTEGLLMAGKSISGSRFACSSYRVQPIVAQIGQACGTAAALATHTGKGLREISVTDLQSKLQQGGMLSS